MDFIFIDASEDEIADFFDEDDHARAVYDAIRAEYEAMRKDPQERLRMF